MNGATTLVLWERRHEPGLARLANDPAIARWLTPRFPQPYLETDAAAWVVAQAGCDPQLNFAIEAGGTLVGSIGLTAGLDEPAGSLSVGYFIGRPFWGRGYATESLRAVTAYAFGLGSVNRVWASVMAPNLGSMRVLERAGYRREATLPGAIADRFGVRHDEHRFFASVARPGSVPLETRSVVR